MINLHAVGRKNPKTKVIVYYPSVVHCEPKNVEDFYESISQESTITRHDVKAVVSALEEGIIRHLQDGYSVRLGDLGSFHVTLSTTASTSAKEVSKKNITAVKVQFTPSASLHSGMSLNNSTEVKLSMPTK